MSQPIFENDVETILNQKIAYHKEQAKLHFRLASETREKLNLLTANSIKQGSGLPAPDLSQNEIIEELENIEAPVMAMQEVGLPIDTNFSVRVWKKRVENTLKANINGHLKTDEIVNAIDSRYLLDQKFRKQAVGAVSSSLFALVEKGFVEKIPGEGRGNLYKWKK